MQVRSKQRIRFKTSEYVWQICNVGRFCIQKTLIYMFLIFAKCNSTSSLSYPVTIFFTFAIFRKMLLVFVSMTWQRDLIYIGESSIPMKKLEKKFSDLGLASARKRCLHWEFLSVCMCVSNAAVVCLIFDLFGQQNFIWLIIYTLICLYSCVWECHWAVGSFYYPWQNRVKGAEFRQSMQK